MKKHYLLLFIAALLFIILHYLGRWSNSPYVWGVDQWRYFSRTWTVTFTIACLVVWIPFINRKIAALFDVIFRLAERIPARLRWISISGIVSFIFLELFLYFRIKTHFLGDGYLRLRNLRKLSEYQVNNVLDVYDYMNFNVYSFFQNIFKVSPLVPFILVSVLCGIGFVITAVYISKQFKNGEYLFLLLVFTGTIQLYFGYVEIYAISTLLVILYFYFSIRCIRGDAGIYYPVLILIIGIAFHFSLLFFVPSLLYLAWSRYGDRLYKSVFGIIMSICLLSGIIILFVIFNAWEFLTAFIKGGHTLKLFRPANDIMSAYSLFSFSHFADVFNGYQLAVPLLLFTLMLVIMNFKILKEKIDPPGIFLLTAIGGYVIFTFFINFEIGIFRDWDLFSQIAIPVVIFTFLLITEYFDYEPKKLLLILTVYSIVQTVPWILLNSDEKKSVDRFHYLTETAVTGKFAKGYAYDELRAYYAKRKEYFTALKFAEKAYISVESERYLYNISGCYYSISDIYFENGDLNTAEGYLLKGYSFYPDNINILNRLGIIYIKTGRYEEALEKLERVVELDDTQFQAYNNLGNLYARFGDRQRAIENYKRAVGLNPAIVMLHYNLAKEYEKNDDGIRYGPGYDFDSAVAEYKEIFTLDDNMLDAHFNLAFLYSITGQDSLAEQEYKKVINIDGGYATAYYNLALIYENRKEYGQALSFMEKARDLGLGIEPSVIADLRYKARKSR